MPRKGRPERLALTRLEPRGGSQQLEHVDDDEPHDDAACLLCTLIDNDDDEPLRTRLARVLAYGSLVLADGGGVSTCGDCHDAIEDEIDDLERELRALPTPRRRRAGR